MLYLSGTILLNYESTFILVINVREGMLRGVALDNENVLKKIK